MVGHAKHTVGDNEPRSKPGRLVDGPARGRGAQLNPANRFDRLSLEVLDEHLEHAASECPDGTQVATEVYEDASRSIVNPVDSPDLSFKWTINPYRGCEHGCVYCYARPTHEQLGFSSGLEFETKIVAKSNAPDLLRKALAKRTWRGEPIVMSGVTDPYQPVESKLRITRGCLEVMAEANQCVGLVTKSRLILRDLDLLAPMAERGLVRAAVSVTSLDNSLSSKMEPRAASPRDRLWTIRRLASAGIPVTVMVAPVVPGLNDRETPHILEAAADAGATNAAFILLRLPHQNRELFDDWLEHEFPDRREHVLSLMRSAHGGDLYDSSFGKRQRGSGAYAKQIGYTFRLFARRYGLDRPTPPYNTTLLRKPAVDNQLPLFA